MGLRSMPFFMDPAQCGARWWQFSGQNLDPGMNVLGFPRARSEQGSVRGVLKRGRCKHIEGREGKHRENGIWNEGLLPQ